MTGARARDGGSLPSKKLLFVVSVAAGLLVIIVLKNVAVSTGTQNLHPRQCPMKSFVSLAQPPRKTGLWHHGHWNSSCWLPPSGYKAWGAGVVTTLLPNVERNCRKLFARDKHEVTKVKEGLKIWKNAVSDSSMLLQMRNCTWLRDYFSENLYVTKLEKSFPVAYTLVVHNNAQQVLRLLRFLYRPHNAYCLHPDTKASNIYISILCALTLCFDNIIMPENLLSVKWGHRSIMEAQMLCMKELMLYRDKQPEHRKWRYVINLCGKELPLATTHETVTKLAKLNGSSSIGVFKAEQEPSSVVRLKGRKIPFNLTFYKSLTYGAISYEFAHFLHTNETASKVLEFFKDSTIIPEEHVYATLYMMPGVPGGYDPRLKDLYFEVDFAIWLTGSARKKFCGGKDVHGVCIVSVYELKEILGRTKNGAKYLFHNKYFMEMDHVVMDCMEERLVARNRLEYEQDCPENKLQPR